VILASLDGTVARQPRPTATTTTKPMTEPAVKATWSLRRPKGGHKSAVVNPRTESLP